MREGGKFSPKLKKWKLQHFQLCQWVVFGSFHEFFSLSVFGKLQTGVDCKHEKKTLLPASDGLWVEVAANRYRGTTGIAAHVEDPVSFGPFGDGFG